MGLLGGDAVYLIADLPRPIVARVTVDEASGCWKAGGHVDRAGYARLGSRMLHRVVYMMLTGEKIPAGYHLDHVKARGCIWRCCIWPAHLEPVTPAENWRRIGYLSGVAAINAPKDECDNGHPFDLFNTYFRPNGHRDCRTCIRARVAKYQRRLRGETRAPEHLGLAA